jgi:hypothetical protein
MEIQVTEGERIFKLFRRVNLSVNAVVVPNEWLISGM